MKSHDTISLLCIFVFKKSNMINVLIHTRLVTHKYNTSLEFPNKMHASLSILDFLIHELICILLIIFHNFVFYLVLYPYSHVFRENELLYMHIYEVIFPFKKYIICIKKNKVYA